MFFTHALTVDHATSLTPSTDPSLVASSFLATTPTLSAEGCDRHVCRRLDFELLVCSSAPNDSTN